MQILMWIHLAERSLSIDELLHALATEPGNRDLDRDNFPGKNVFLNCCLGLAIVDDETSTVRLVHYSLEEYLKTQDQLFPRGHEKIAKVCLTYLMFESVTSGPISKKMEDKIKPEIQGTLRPSQLALLNYASCEWGHHARKGHPLEKETAALALKYLSEDLREHYGSIGYLCQNISEKMYIGDLQGFVSFFSRLHIAAFFGIHQVLPGILCLGLCPDSVDIIGRTPLRLFNVARDPAALLRAGDGVRFVAITREEFERWGK